MKRSAENPKLDALFAALANRHRREIILVLSQQAATITQLAHFRDLSLPAIHKHIKILEQSGLLTRKKIGRFNVLTLNRASLRGIQKWVTQFHAYWDGGDDAWMEWFTAIGKSIVDIGNPFNGGTLVKQNNVTEITEWSDFVGGYSLVNAEDIAAAIILAKGCPNKAGVRVFEAIPM